MFTDLRFALRQIAKSPGYAGVAVLTLALGIGASTAFFSVTHGMLWRPLAYPDQDRLVVLSERCEQEPFQSISYPNYLDWRARQSSFTALGVACPWGANYVGADVTEHLSGAQASHDVFAALGVPAIRGRLFDAADDEPGAARTVVIRASLWRRLFDGRDSAIGEKIQLAGEFYTIIGVLPDAFQFPNPQKELWVPLGLWSDQHQNRAHRFGLYGVARLKPGVTLAMARADLGMITGQLAAEYPAPNRGHSAALEKFTDDLFGDVSRNLCLLLAAAGFVLLIACANVANLQLARVHARAHEFGIRAALGASRCRLVRQQLVESLLLGSLGCAAGLVAATWFVVGLKWLLPADLPRLQEIGLSRDGLLFAIGASGLTSIVFGLIPALYASRRHLQPALASSARGGGRRLRASLIVGQFALTCVLLTGTGLMLRTLGGLHRSELGYATANLVTFDWQLTGGELDQKPARLRLIEQARTRLAHVPGVTEIGLCDQLPLTSGRTRNGYHVEGTVSVVSRPDGPMADCFVVNGDYFATLGITLVAGRAFDARDQTQSPCVAIVDTTFVERNFPGQNPLGRRFAYGNRPPHDATDWRQIVGVVAHVRSRGPRLEMPEQTYVTVHPRTTDMGDIRFADRADASVARAGVARRDARSLPGPAGLFGGNHAKPVRRMDRHRAHDFAPAGRLRRARADARRSRSLRRADLRDRAAHTRDRCAHGLGRDRSLGCRPRHTTRFAPRECRAGCRPGRRCRPHATAAKPALPSVAVRSVEFCRGGTRSRRDRPDRLLVARPPRHARRSDRSAADGVGDRP